MVVKNEQSNTYARFYNLAIWLFVFLILQTTLQAQNIISNGEPAELNIRKAGENSIRITLKPVNYKGDFPFSPALSSMQYLKPVINLLIGPVFEKGAADLKVYLPKGDWYDWWTSEKQSGGKYISRKVDLATMPMYAPAGAINPFDPIRQYVNEKVEEPTTIKIFTGKYGRYILYNDDGISQEYVKGKGSWISFEWNDKTNNYL